MEYSNSFENHLREQGKAEKTIQSYTGDEILSSQNMLSLKREILNV